MINTHGFFESIFKNAKENSVIMMNRKGEILEVNKSFLTAFGYLQKNLVGKNFSVLFTEKDIAAHKPKQEIKKALATGSKSDNNYLLHKNGTPLWVMGESIAVTNTAGEQFIVKIIQNINSQKKLERFLIESNEFLDTIFASVKDAGFLVLNSELRVERTNKTFQKIFDIKKIPASGCKLSQLESSFWKTSLIKKSLTDLLVSGKGLKGDIFNFTDAAGKKKVVEITSKIISGEETVRSILLVIKVK
jgi:PAS domain S-box-containing protein